MLRSLLLPPRRCSRRPGVLLGGGGIGSWPRRPYLVLPPLAAVVARAYRRASRIAIAIAIVIEARWGPLRALVAGYRFGAATGLGFVPQIRGVSFPSKLLSTTPFVTTLVTVVRGAEGGT